MCRLNDVVFFFFFQAEDCIRDLVRSRGLGDVYKRQLLSRNGIVGENQVHEVIEVGVGLEPRPAVPDIEAVTGGRTCEVDHHASAHQAVSYTHLTLPTSDLV